MQRRCRHRRSPESFGRPIAQSGELLIASSDGSVVDVFDPSGQHKRTVHALTGAVLYEFGYDGEQLVSITDGDNNVTQIRHNEDGSKEIEGPFGQVTTITLEEKSGFIETITDPAGEKWQFTYTKKPEDAFDQPGAGLLTEMRDPRITEMADPNAAHWTFQGQP
jgi:hypothetical protein